MTEPVPYDVSPGDIQLKIKTKLQKLRRIIKALRLPAGPDPRFSTLPRIAQNQEAFTAAVHTTWKDIQAEAIREIVHVEMLLAKRGSAMPRGMAQWLRHLGRLWRRVNDAVAWRRRATADSLNRVRTATMTLAFLGPLSAPKVLWVRVPLSWGDVSSP